MPQLLKRIVAIIRRFVYQSQRWLIVYSPAGGPPAADRVGDITYRVATYEDLDRLEELEQYGRGATHRRYVEKDNDWLFLACHGDRIVATRRGSRVIRDSVIARVIQLRPDQYWGADVFCLPEYRGRGIARHLQAFGDRYCASLGYKDRLGTIGATNTASINMNRATGTQPLYYVVHTRIFFWESLRVTKDIPTRVWGGATREPPRPSS
jgi:GNAT superfamily N-acetyltransferase